MTKTHITSLITVWVTVLLLAAPNGAAHQQKAAQTTVLFNLRSNHLEVMHRFYLHDTEHAVQALFDQKAKQTSNKSKDKQHADIFGSANTQQQFADYVAKQFLVRTIDDKPLPLSNVGYEIEGKFFWVYQQAPLPWGLKAIKLYNGTLRDLWPTQINMVNIENKETIRTLYFSDHKDWLIATF